MKWSSFMTLSLPWSFCFLTASCTPPIDPDKPVSEFPASLARDYRSRGGAILDLCRLEPDTSPEAKRALAEDRDAKTVLRSTIVQQVSIDDGQIVGFRSRNSDLFAIAGRKAIALPPGHYAWQLLSQDPRGHGSSGVLVDPTLNDFTDILRDAATDADDKYNGARRRDLHEPAPDLSP